MQLAILSAYLPPSRTQPNGFGMEQNDVERVLLLESHRLVAEAAANAVRIFGKLVPAEARADFLSEKEKLHARKISSEANALNDPIFRKVMKAGMASVSALSYPPDGEISAVDADALESLQLTPAQANVAERVIAEACHNTLFNFFCLLDSVADPEVSDIENWQGARMTSPREEEPMLHDEFGDTFHDYRELTKGSNATS